MTKCRVLNIYSWQRWDYPHRCCELSYTLTFPLYSAYNATKWALEGFMEALQFELSSFNIQVKNIEPTTVKSAFTNFRR